MRWGLWLPNETEVENPFPDLVENETTTGSFLSNRPGTVAIAHGIGVNGNSDIFINLEVLYSLYGLCLAAFRQENDYLDTMSLGFCAPRPCLRAFRCGSKVFAEVADPESFRVVRALAAAVLKDEKPVISQAKSYGLSLPGARRPFWMLRRGGGRCSWAEMWRFGRLRSDHGLLGCMRSGPRWRCSCRRASLAFAASGRSSSLSWRRQRETQADLAKAARTCGRLPKLRH